MLKSNFAGACIASFAIVLLALIDHALAGSLPLGARTLAVLGAASMGALLLLPLFWSLAALLAKPLDRPWIFRVEVFLCVAFWALALWSLGVYLQHPRLPLAMSQLYWYGYGAAPALLLGGLAARASFAKGPTIQRQTITRAALVGLALWGLWWNPHFRQYPSQIVASSALAVAALLLTRPLAQHARLAHALGIALVSLALFGVFFVGGSPTQRDQAARGGRLTRLLLRATTPLLRPFGQTLEDLADESTSTKKTERDTHPLDASLTATKATSVLLITVDALRADLGGLEQNDTLKRLKQESVVFTRARATAANTIESMTSIFLGRYSFAGIKGPSLPGILRRAGLFTINIQPVNYLTRKGGHGWIDEDFDHLVASLKHEYAFAPNSSKMTDAMLQGLEKAEGEPFFAWMHYNDPHHPYDAPGETDLERYRSEVDATFKEIGRLLDEMQRRGWLDHTMIIVTADHGEEFLEHDGTTHSLTLYDEVLRVPLLIRAPGGAVRETYNESTSLLGLAPALLSWLDIKDDASFAPERRYLFAGDSALAFAFRRLEGLHFGDGAVVQGRYKLIYSFEVEAAQLYDIEADPGETTNIAQALPEKTRELAAALLDEIQDANN